MWVILKKKNNINGSRIQKRKRSLMFTAEALYESFAKGGQTGPAILVDLFGYQNWTTLMKQNRNETLCLFFGLYKGLFLREVPWQEIQEAFYENKLDELIHSKYAECSSGYYQEFCDKNIQIGPTYITEPEEELEEKEYEEEY